MIIVKDIQVTVLSKGRERGGIIAAMIQILMDFILLVYTTIVWSMGLHLTTRG